MPEEHEEMYEIVPTTPLSSMEHKNQSLEKEIQDIKAALRGTAGLAKLEENADTLVEHLLGLMKSSQTMVEQVAASNQKVAGKIQDALERMDATNQALTQKLDKILNFFAQATESMGEESDEGGATEEALGGLTHALDALVKQNEKTHQLLGSIEKNLKRAPAPQMQRPNTAQYRQPPTRNPYQPSQVPNRMPPAPRMAQEEELPPPPFPP